MRTAITVLACGLLLAGCQTTAKSTAANDAIIQQAPLDYRKQIIQFVALTVKDPYSIRSAEIAAPKVGWAGIQNGGTRPIVCTKFNAKNSFGAYIGIQTVGFPFDKNGRVSQMIPGAIACGPDVIYEPFPELEGKEPLKPIIPAPGVSALR